MISLNPDKNIWDQFYTIHSLVIVGSVEDNGEYNMAPKHMAMPLGFDNYFSFIGTPRKSTYHNVKREGVFTVSYPRPSQLILTSLAASPREEDHSKPIISKLPIERAKVIDGIFLEDSYLQLECELVDILGSFGEWELMVGEIVAAYADEQSLRSGDVDDEELVYNAPLLGYLYPDRFTVIEESQSFPFPKNFKR